MYKRKSKGWYKHKDFIVLDMLCMFLAFVIAYMVRNGNFYGMIRNRIYLYTLIFALVMDFLSVSVFEFFHGVIRRGYYQ